MESGVFVLHGDNTLVKMVPQPYEAESLLQQLLADHPDLLAGDQINPSAARRWLLIRREVGVPASEGGGDWWAVDHLFLDQDAVPTFVEVKRATDTRARREVVAQMLDYAANASAYWPVDRMREEFARRCVETNADSATELADFLGADGDVEAFWDLARANLRDGRVRLLFVADTIPAPLRRIVEFLNRQMNPAEVLAVEIRQFAATSGTELRTLVPTVIGQSEQVREDKQPSKKRASPSFVPVSREEFVARFHPDRRDTAVAILQTAEQAGFAVEQYRSFPTRARAPFTLAGAPGYAATLELTTLWVDLGDNYESLRDPIANSQLRQLLLQIAPTHRPITNQQKSYVGIPIGAIGPDGLGLLPALFGLLRSLLLEGTTIDSRNPSAVPSS